MAELTRKQIAGAMALRKIKEVPKFGKEDVEAMRPMFKNTLQGQLKPLEPLPEPTPFVPQDIQDAPSNNALEWLVNRVKGNYQRDNERQRKQDYLQAVGKFKARKRNIEAIEKNRPMDEAVLAHEMTRQRRGYLPGQMQPLDVTQFMSGGQ